ncbi:MAG TPA: hypothetical protein VHM25_13660 [Polyangiaceae bacterium]|nr:hypothetical protein [Polyangiaceae bacterium]
MSRWQRGKWLAAVLGFAGLLAACQRRELPEGQRGAEPKSAVSKAVQEAESAESRACAATLSRLEAEPALPGAVVNAGFERGHLLGRARAEPVAFVRTPHFDTQTGSLRARALREELQVEEHPAFAFERVLSEVKKSPELAREVFLTEGYLYSERPALAALFVNYLALGLLFREPELRIARGADVWTLKRRDSDYEYADGPLRGERARLLLFDRVFVAGKEPGPALHVDLRAVAAQSLSDEIALQRITETGVVASLRFGKDWSPAAFKRSGSALQLHCQRVPPALREVTSQARALAKRRAHVTEVLARVVKNEVEEGLPFDEPKTEEGQQDGQLRPAWRRAYLDGRDRFTFNEDSYWVFDSRGRPHVPQVCIDFVTDTLERASGARFRPRGERREFVRGALDFDSFGLDNRRSVETFIGFARAHPEWFEFTETSLAERVPFRERTAFFRDIYEHRDEYRPFDIVTVFGLRNDGKLHHHSFFVADRDPLTGMPIAVVANAGRPRIRSWENELQNAPQRGILAHIRPKLPWLEALVAPEGDLSTQGAPVQNGSAG